MHGQNHIKHRQLKYNLTVCRVRINFVARNKQQCYMSGKQHKNIENVFVGNKKWAPSTAEPKTIAHSEQC